MSDPIVFVMVQAFAQSSDMAQWYTRAKNSVKYGHNFNQTPYPSYLAKRNQRTKLNILFNRDNHSHRSLAGSRPPHARASSPLAAADRPFSLRSSAVSAVFRRSIAAMCAAPASPRPLTETSSAVSVRFTSSA